MKVTLRSLTGFLALSFVAACAESPTAPGELTPAGRGALTGGSALTASKTATGFFENQIEYDWTFEKRLKDVMNGWMIVEPSTTETEVLPGQVKWVHYEFTATRNIAAKHRLVGARGEICVKNIGDEATTDLQITDVVQHKVGDAWVDLASSAVPTASKPQLEAGESHCYPYQVPFDGEPGTEYRNSAIVTVTNHAGQGSEPYGPGSSGSESSGVLARFTVPSVPATTTKDATATMYEGIAESCANIFPSILCMGSESFKPVTLTKTTTFGGELNLDMHNYRVCGQEFRFTNRARLVEGGPYAPGTEPQTHSDSATLLVTTGDCAPKPVETGCTLTQGYWKNHAWPLHPVWPPSTLATWPDIVGWKFFDTGLEWPEVLDVSPRGDAYFILAHQYIAAILNQQNGTYVPEEVRQTLEDAYHYFSLTKAERDAFDRELLTTWATLLDQYNNGRLGVPHCG